MNSTSLRQGSAPLQQLKLVALNIDGVLLTDTFSPVIHRFVTGHGAAYTAELERRVFSQPQHIAGQRMAEVIGGGLSGEQALAAYFEERTAYVAEQPVEVTDGAVELISRIRGLGVKTVCYGGLGKEHFDRFLGGYAELFDGPGYVCTNDFRPGLREIATDIFDVKYDEMLVVDDVARVAEAAASLNMPFIGHPSDFKHSYQRQLMREAGVRYLVGSLRDIDEVLLRTLDAEAAAGKVWEAIK